MQKDSEEAQQIIKEISVVKPESDEESDESDDGDETPASAQSGFNKNNEVLVCRGEPIPFVYEDRLGALYRREAGSLQDF